MTVTARKFDARTLTTAEVEASIITALTARGHERSEDNHLWPWLQTWVVAARVADLHGGDGNYPGKSFEGKVRRVLDSMEERRLVVKRTGLGHTYRNHPRWALHEFVDQYDLAREQERSAEENADRRTKQIIMGFANAGFEVGRNGNRIVLDADQAERILELLAER